MKYGLVALMRYHFGPDWFRIPIEPPFPDRPMIDWAGLLDLGSHFPAGDSNPDSDALASFDGIGVAAEDEEALASLLSALFGPSPGAADAPPAALDFARIFAVMTEEDLSLVAGIVASEAVFPLDQPPI